MTPEERQLLTELFERVRTASGNMRDPEAEAFIAEQVRAQPYAPYLMAQAVIVQEEGLKKAAARIEELERAQAQSQSAPQTGGFLGSVFGAAPRPSGLVPSVGGAARPSGPWGAGAVPVAGQQQAYQQQAPVAEGGSFLRNALGTVAGVAGGVLLAHSLSSLFTGNNNSHGIAGDMGNAGNASAKDITGGVFDPPSTPAPANVETVQPASFDDGGGWDSGGDGSFDT